MDSYLEIITTIALGAVFGSLLPLIFQFLKYKLQRHRILRLRKLRDELKLEVNLKESKIKALKKATQDTELFIKNNDLYSWSKKDIKELQEQLLSVLNGKERKDSSHE